MADHSFFELIDNSDQVIKEMEAAVARGLTKCAVKAEGYAKDLCPVDTGTLRRSITNKVLHKEAWIGTNVEYAPYVELGTGSQYFSGGSPEAKYQRAPRPYLKPAASEHTDEYKAIIEAELKG